MDYLQNLGGPASFVKIIGPGVVILSQAIVMPNLLNPKALKLNKKIRLIYF